MGYSDCFGLIYDSQLKITLSPEVHLKKVNINYIRVQVRPVDEDDEIPPPPPAQKIVPRVQVVQQQTPPQPRQTVSYSQPSQAQQNSPRPAAQTPTQTVNVEGEARVRYSFKAETHRELPCSKVQSYVSVMKSPYWVLVEY